MAGRIKLLNSFVIRILCNIRKGKISTFAVLGGKRPCGDYHFFGSPLPLFSGVVSFKMWWGVLTWRDGNQYLKLKWNLYRTDGNALIPVSKALFIDRRSPGSVQRINGHRP